MDGGLSAVTGLGSRLLWTWFGLVAVLSVTLFLLGGYQSQGFSAALSAAAWLLLPVVYTGLGAVIATRDPGNRIAWILLVVGMGVLVDGAVQPLVAEAPMSPTFLDYLALFLSNSMWVFIFFPLFLMLYLFPTGRFLGRRWKWAGWLTSAMLIGFFTLGAFIETWSAPSDEWAIANPIGFIPDPIWDGVFNIVLGLGLITLPVGGFVALMVRFRRSAVVERAQIKWVLYAALVFALGYVAAVVSAQVLVAGFGDLVIGNLFALSLIILPISITAAITRYRLFDIDRIISRTLSYTVIIALLGALYFGVVTLVGTLLPTQNALAVAGSTLAVAAAFNPFRRRVQRWVDRSFNRSAYRAEVVTDEFAARLRESLTADDLAQLWLRTVSEFLQPTASGVWFIGSDAQAARTQKT